MAAQTIHSMKAHTENKNYKAVILITLVVAIFLGSYFIRRALERSVQTAPTQNEHADYPQRIVALAPSLVEVVYQLELDGRLVGISRFCKYPEDAATKPVVGGYLDLDFEALLKLEPDCVILLEEQNLLADRLHELGIKTLIIDHASTSGILSSIHVIGANFGKASSADNLMAGLQERIKKIDNRAQIKPNKPRVLVCISRDTSSSQPERIIAAGNAGVHQEYITMAGGTNAYQGNIAFPTISREKLLQINPDIIIELISADTLKDIGRTKLLQQWASYPELKAVQNQKIIFLHENKHMIPGPRFVDTLEAFANAMHPPQS